MLPIVLVLLVAQGAFSASVQVSAVPRSEYGPIYDNGNSLNRYVTNGAFDIVDGGELSLYLANVQEVIHDLANGDSASQALAIGQTIATLSELVNGLPGDACEYAKAIDTYADYLNGKCNAATLRQALRGYYARVVTGIRAIANYAKNPENARFTRGPSSGCAAGGRNSNIEPVWDAILSNASVQSIGPLNEQYCATKRLYNAIGVLPNNVGAAVTSASLPSNVQVYQRVIGPLGNFLRALSGGNDVTAAAQAAERALVQAADNYVL